MLVNIKSYFPCVYAIAIHQQAKSQLLVILYYCVIIILTFLNCLLSAEELNSNNSIPVINEIMSINTTTIQDRDGDYPDWIEIYNPSDSAVDLTGYGLSDNPSEPLKWVFPKMTIQPGEFKLIFASDKNYLTENNYLHTNFKIKSDGETLLLSDSTGFVVDQLMTIQLQSDQSWGRQPDGNTEWFYFNQSTPGTSNTTIGYSAYSSPVEFSFAAGFYQNTISVNITCASANAEIRYTTDCSEPDQNSILYSEPLTISRTTVLRARSFETGLLPGKVLTHTYFLNEDITLPVISLSTDPEHLYDPETGIYENFWEEWERPIHFEFFETDGTQKVNVDAGIMIGGGATRARPQKTFRIYFRSQYGANKINYQIFPNLPIFEFTSLFLRNSGNDWDQTHFRDGFLQTLVNDLDLDTQAYRPAVTFLNGEYWGILNIRERLTEDYLASHYGVDPDNVDLLEIAHPNDYVSVIEGDLNRFNSIYSYIQNNDFQNDTHYEYIQTQLDINNFLDYVISEIYFNNTDWPNNNVKFWHPRTETGKFRMMLFDLDWSYGYQRLRLGDEDKNTYKANTLVHALGADKLHIALMFRKFLENNQFKTEFINRFADYLNTEFHPDHVLMVISGIQRLLESEMPRHYDKFKHVPISFWYQCINIVENFAKNRPLYIREHIKNYFGFTGIVLVNLQISPTNSGNITVNHVRINKSPWQGNYFTDVPVKLTAVPNIGFRFTGWTGDVESDLVTITKTLTEEISLTANFERDESAVNFIVINEINYNSADDFDPGDWIELHNAIDKTVDISGWVILDENDPSGYSVPPNTIIGPMDYLVFCTDQAKFHQSFPEISNYIGDLGFGFNNTSELVRLYDREHILVDSVQYSDSPPWPVQPDGSGPTLMLRNPNLDNSIPQNWMSSNKYGTPGRANQSLAGVGEEESQQTPLRFQLNQNYPNPFNSVTKISYSISMSDFVTLKIYDILGKEVYTLVNRYQVANKYLINFDAGTLSSGVYFYRLKVGNDFVQTKKMLLMR